MCEKKGELPPDRLVGGILREGDNINWVLKKWLEKGRMWLGWTRWWE